MKNKAAQALGRRGGLIGGINRAASMTPEERSRAASKAARARWDGHQKPVSRGRNWQQHLTPTEKAHKSAVAVGQEGTVMITRSADEISKMKLEVFLKEHQGSSLFLNSCTMMAAVTGSTGEEAIVAYALGIGISLATNDVVSPEDMTGFDGYMEKIKAMARLAYESAYMEVKGLHDKAQEQAGMKTERPS